MSPANCWNLRVTAEADQGNRKYMEDVTSVQFERIKSEKAVVEYAAFAVFDGHGGKDAAHFARDHLLENIKQQKGFFSNDVEVVKKAIADAFVATHLAMWNKLPDWPKTSLGHPSTAGTTASLVIIRGSRMYVANVGDSMIVMGIKDNEDDPSHPTKSYGTIDLTIDHKPESYKERRRIEKCGGCVMNKSGVNRVVWARPKISHTGPIRRSTKLDQIPFLAVARSLGDLWSFNSELNEFVVSPVPDVYVHDLQKNKDQFIVLASDGLWNMVRPQEAVKFVERMEADKMKGDSWGSPAHRLVQIALARWAMRRMRADNISVVVVFVESRKLEPSKRKGVYFESWTSAKEDMDGSMLSSPFSGTTQTLKAIPNKPTHDATTSKSPSQPSTSAKNSEPLQDSSISSSNGDVSDDVVTTLKPRMKTRFSNDPQLNGSGIKERRLTRSQGKKSPEKKASKRRKTMSDIPIGGGVKTRRMSLRPVRIKKTKSEEKVKLPKTPARVSTKTRRRL